MSYWINDRICPSLGNFVSYQVCEYTNAPISTWGTEVDDEIVVDVYKFDIHSEPTSHFKTKVETCTVGGADPTNDFEIVSDPAKTYMTLSCTLVTIFTKINSMKISITLSINQKRNLLRKRYFWIFIKTDLVKSL